MPPRGLDPNGTQRDTWGRALGGYAEAEGVGEAGWGLGGVAGHGLRLTQLRLPQTQIVGAASGAFALWARPSAVNLGYLSLNHSGHLSHTLSMHVCEAWCVTSLL